MKHIVLCKNDDNYMQFIFGEQKIGISYAWKHLKANIGDTFYMKRKSDADVIRGGTVIRITQDPKEQNKQWIMFELDMKLQGDIEENNFWKSNGTTHISF